ncbi:MAG: hypothetical protein KDK97_16575, partial [Verrucomicrobiales bacterium]|nr:hypothetical protein [Verrucomicrobiales bacterium]
LLLRIQDNNVFNFNELSRSGVGELSAPMLVNNHRTEMKSRRFAEYFCDQLPEEYRDGYVLPDLQNVSMTTRIKEAIGLGEKKKAPNLREVFIKKITDAVRVEPLKDSHILRVQVRGSNPALTADLANKFSASYITYVAEQELSTPRQTSEFLKVQSDEQAKRLREAEERLVAYRQQASVMKENPTADPGDSRVRLLTAALSEAQVRETKARHDLETIEQTRAAGRDLMDVRAIAENGDVSATRKVLNDRRAELTILQETCGPRHPRVIALNKEIAEQQSKLQAYVEAVAAMIAQEVETQARQVEDFQKQVNQARTDVISLGDKQIQENMLEGQVKMAREIYQETVTRMNQAALTGSFKDTGTLRISDSAIPPEKALKPNKMVALIASMMSFGLFFLGVPLSLGVYEDHVAPLLSGVSTHDRQAAPAQQQSAHLPQTPQRPAVNPFGPQTVQGPFNLAPPQMAQPPPQSQIPAAQVPPPMTLMSNGRPTVLAQFPMVHWASESDSVLAGVLRAEPAGAAAALQQLTVTLEKQALTRSGLGGVIAVTSAEPGEGKSLAAAALAATFCHHGRSVLVIDCHAAHPGLHHYFPHAAAHSAAAQRLESLRYGQSSLFLLPALDMSGHDTNELLDGYRAWIDRARYEIDWIILDCPPVLKNFADMAPLAPLASDMILVHDPLRATPAKLRAALTLLQPMMSTSALRGVVVNRAGDQSPS